MKLPRGVGPLIGLALRRDRVLLPAWIVGLSALAAATAAASVEVYPTEAARVTAAEAINAAPSLVALYGPIADPTSLGAVSMVKMVTFGAAMVAVLMAMITVRHSRAEEEAGRLELVGATAVDRPAPLLAALTIAAGASMTLGLATATGLALAGLPLAGSMAFGAAWSGVGLAFAGAAALAAQVARSARSATGLTMGVLGASYVLRALGDASARVGWLAWLSPLGWAHRVHAFAGNRWSVLLLLVGFAATTSGMAMAMSARRDLGAGMLTDRAGPADAHPALRNALGLAWRLERGALLGWAVAFAMVGALIGSIAGDVGSLVNTDQAQDFIRRLGGEKALSDAFLAAEFSVLGLVNAAYGVHAALRLRTEETTERAEAVLATAVPRSRWAIDHLVVAVVGTTCLALCAGATAGIVRAVQTGEARTFFEAVGASLVQLPAIWVVVAVVAAAFGVATRFAVAGWLALVAFLVVGELGALFKLPQPVIDLSPFAHVPKLPGSVVDAAPLVTLVAVAVLLTAGGLVALRHRDIG